ncbi:MAG: thymidylate synthase [Candidatus Berkelbacteria bacterium]
MYKIIEPFGIHVYGESIGEAWLSLVQAVLDKGEICSDEGRLRAAIRNVRIRADSQKLPDNLIEKFGNQENLKNILELTFNNEDMFDIDIIPSFTPREKKSYYYRIKEGRMVDFVVARLSEIPESKKAVIVFPTWDDYKAVLKSPQDDYLPCLVSVQFRMQPMKDSWVLDTVFNARSIDAFQKSYANLWAIAKLSEIVAAKIAENRKEEIIVGSLDGVITDAHIYKETFGSARKTVDDWYKFETEQLRGKEVKNV